jgi:hypothetical protein
MPSGKTNVISEQDFFTSVEEHIHTDHKQMFFSDEYFFKATFNAENFDSAIAAMNAIMDSDCNSETAAYLLGRFANIYNELNDRKLQDFVNIHIKYYSKFENKDYGYAEMNEIIKHKIAQNN